MNLIPLNFITQGEQTPLRRMMLERALAGGGALSEYEITGNPVAFNTNLARPLSGFTIPFLPVQTGSGDPSPQNPRPISGWSGVTAWRTGANLFDEQWTQGNIQEGQDTPSTSAMRTGFINVHPSTSYYCYTERTANVFIFEYDNEGNYLNRVKNIATGKLFATGAGTGKIRIVDRNSGTEAVDTGINFPFTVTTYAPYTGQSYPVTFPALGKNLCDGKAYSVNISRDIPQVLSLTPVTSPFTTGYNYSGVGFIARVNANVTYALSSDVTGANVYFYCGLYASLDDVTDRSNVLQYATTADTFTPIADGYLVFMRYNASLGTEVTWSYAQCEEGSTATAYEPYTNTVYGGALDAVNGVLTVEWGSVNMGSLAWELRNNGNVYWFYSDNVPGLKIIPDSGILSTIMCEMYKTVLGAYIYGGQAGDNVIGQDGSVPRIRIRDDSFNNDADAFKTAMDGIMLYFELATPIEIPLDPITVQTLIGDNTIWTDTNGENTVKYKKKG